MYNELKKVRRKQWWLIPASGWNNWGKPWKTLERTNQIWIRDLL